MINVTTMLKVILDSGIKQIQIEAETGIPQPRISRWANGDVCAAVNDALVIQQIYEKVVAKERRKKKKPALLT
ncbi:MAG: hypothetical protein IPH08_05440 [Rhodocyclaceae bacterium]|nr:hypothetical protein [Rhodocyclaceae bacterium]